MNLCISPRLNYKSTFLFEWKWSCFFCVGKFTCWFGFFGNKFFFLTQMIRGGLPQINNLHNKSSLLSWKFRICYADVLEHKTKKQQRRNNEAILINLSDLRRNPYPWSQDKSKKKREVFDLHALRFEMITTSQIF